MPNKILNDMTTKTHRNLLLFVLVFCAVSAFSNNQGSSTTVFETLMRDGVLDITIETDLYDLINNRRRDDYQPATLSYKDKDGTTVRRQIEVAPRGKFRRRVCDFPPVKIKFPKKELVAAGLKKHNNLKLTTHCLDDRDAGNYNVFKEYLSYKLYNELTPNSFRVQLVRVTYIDATGQVSKTRRYGFLLEDDEELAERMGGKLCECLGSAPEDVSRADEAIMATFQYMIGNADWNLAMARNLKMVAFDNGAPIIPVPYDFDFSGVVNPSYAVPNTDLGQMRVKDRDYLGLDWDAQTMSNTAALFSEKKPALYRVVSQFKLLPNTMRQEIREYLDTFYQALDTQQESSGKFPAWRQPAPKGAIMYGSSFSLGG